MFGVILHPQSVGCRRIVSPRCPYRASGRRPRTFCTIGRLSTGGHAANASRGGLLGIHRKELNVTVEYRLKEYLQVLVDFSTWPGPMMARCQSAFRIAAGLEVA
jgi:hypothetical protein